MRVMTPTPMNRSPKYSAKNVVNVISMIIGRMNQVLIIPKIIPRADEMTIYSYSFELNYKFLVFMCWYSSFKWFYDSSI